MERVGSYRSFINIEFLIRGCFFLGGGCGFGETNFALCLRLCAWGRNSPRGRKSIGVDDAVAGDLSYLCTVG